MAGNIEPVVITFGGGINSRRRPADLDIDECTAGDNFDLDSQQRSLRTRQAFDLVATAPNGVEIRGFAQLVKRDGTISTLVQAGGSVYSWDGDSTFTLVGSVSTNARLRGPREHIFQLDDLVLITDLEKSENVKSWDGTTFQDLAHNLSSTFKAKYCRVHNERAIFGNVTADNSSLPHVIVASQTSSATTLSTSDQPSSALGLDSPWFLPTPDLKSINGLELGFSNFLISTEEGRVHVLAGSSAFDYEIRSFYDGSAVSGNEALVNIGNDVIMGLSGRIESLTGVLEFGDVETNDLSLPILNSIESVSQWRIAYDQGRQQVFCFPDSRDHVWVLYKSLLRKDSLTLAARNKTIFSPWARWKTTHSMNFIPSTAMALKDPVSKLNVVYMGGSDGAIYRMNGVGALDGGTDAIAVSRTSKLIQVPTDAEMFDLTWWCDYRLQFETTVTLDFIWGGVEYPDDSISFTIPSANFAIYDGAAYSSGDAVYNGDFYYSSKFQTRIRRQTQNVSGRGSYLQVKASYSGEAEIEEIGIKLRAAA